jgi:NDP-sugar pyrophosphorylase family protein
MFAVILAGGSGTRLRPLTHARRKELVPLLGRPLLEYRIENLRDHGVDQIVLACSAKVRELEEHFGRGSELGVHIQYSYEEQPLGSGRAVKEAARMVDAEGTLVVCNGDILTNVDLTSMLAAHWKTHAALSISLAAVDDPWHYGVVDVDDDLRILRFVEKPPQGKEPSNLINAGTWIWEQEILDRIPDDGEGVIDGFSERVLFPSIIQENLIVQGFEEDLWIDVGSPERYLRANALLLERVTSVEGNHVLLDEGASVAPDAQLSGMIYIGPGASIRPGARVAGPSSVGARTEIAAGATIHGSVLWEDVSVGADASIANSIVGGRVVIGAGASLRDAVLADGARVPDGAKLSAGARLMPGEVAN